MLSPGPRVRDPAQGSSRFKNPAAAAWTDFGSCRCGAWPQSGTKKASGLPIGGTLKVLATDPGAVKDFEAFCRTAGNDLLESKGEDKVSIS